MTELAELIPTERLAPAERAKSHDAVGLPASAIDWRSIGIAAVIFSVLSVWMMLANKSFLEADGITHYLARRFALSRPYYFTDIWSRPLCVLIGAIPAYLGGLLATRLMSLAMTLAMAGVTLSVAVRAGLRRPALAVLFLLTEPLLFAHSFSELTEIPFALLVVCAFWAYQRNRFGLLAILAALAPLGRPEGLGVLLVTAVALVAHRRSWWLLVLPVPLIAWSFFGWVSLHHNVRINWIWWLFENSPYSPASVYGHGSPLRFVLILPAVVGPIVFPFIWLGVWRLLVTASNRNDAVDPEVNGSIGRLGRDFFSNHHTRCRLLIGIIPIGVLVAHSLLWATGRMASSGEARYMLIVAPFWAMLGAIGLSWMADRKFIRRPGWIILLAVAAPVATNLYYPVLPLHVQDDEVLTENIATWMTEHDGLRNRYPRLCTAMPMLYWKLDVDRLDETRVLHASVATAKLAPPGTILVWHSKYSDENADVTLAVPNDLLAANGWQRVAMFQHGPMKVEIYLSPKDLSGNPTTP